MNNYKNKNKREVVLSLDIDWITNARDSKVLFETIFPIIKKTKFKKTVFKPSHGEINNLLDTINDPVYIVNIDHHHDIQYHNSDPLDKGYTSGNWLGYYLMKNKIDGITWVANHHSDFNNYQVGPLATNPLSDDLMYITFDIKEIEKYNYDYFFMCLSPHHLNGNIAALQAYDTIEVFYNLCQQQKM